MSATPVEFASKIFELNGAPLHLPPETMRHLYPIYNNCANAILLKFGRQTHKSTTMGYKIALPCLKYRNFHALYVAPTGTQMSVFSTDKLDGALNSSRLIKDHYFDSKTKNQISYKELTNGSKIYLRSAFHSADSIRGISADQIAFDEVQDLLSDNIPVAEQCMSHSSAKWELMAQRVPGLPKHLFGSKIYAGTPKTIENTMERYWANSTQSEFLIKCNNAGCNKYNFINENNIGDLCLICNKCGKPIYYSNGDWVNMNKDGFIRGFRLPQIVLPWINNPNNLDVWKNNVINTRKIYSTEQYFNEVLALPYAAAKHPISVQELMSCCKDYDMVTEDDALTNPIMKLANPIVAGIDWGKGNFQAMGTSFTVLCIAAFHRGRFKVVYMKKYSGRLSDPLVQVKDLLRVINRFNVKLTLADTGDGRVSNAMMVEALGPLKFAEVLEHGTIKKKISWVKDKGHYIFNRTRVMTDKIMDIKRGAVDFFSYDQFKEFQPDFTNIYSNYSDRTRQMLYDHTQPDDAYHAFMFACIACSILRGEYNSYLSGGANEE